MLVYSMGGRGRIPPCFILKLRGTVGCAAVGVGALQSLPYYLMISHLCRLLIFCISFLHVHVMSTK